MVSLNVFPPGQGYSSSSENAAVSGGIVGSSIGVYRSQNPLLLSVNMATNCGIAGVAFFGRSLVTSANSQNKKLISGRKVLENT